MSAYIVQHDTLDVIVSALYHYRLDGRNPVDGRDDREADGRMLLAENYASVNARYREDSTPEEYLYVPTVSVDPASVVMACANYTYQACEHAGWDTSAAKRIVRMVHDEAAMRLAQASGSRWGATNNPNRKANAQRLDA